MNSVLREALSCEELMRIEEVFKALADGNRREILRLLQAGEKTAGELADQLPIGKAAASHHFAVLKAADLIRSRREGQQIYYALNTTVAEDLLTLVWDLFSHRPAPEKGKGQR
jgi:ArsR family transcriptional regulator